MSKSKLAEEFGIVVDGEAYVWRLQRRPQWSHDPKERRGMGIAVRHAEGQREAVLEFPPAAQPPRFNAPLLQPKQIPTELVARGIASAVAAGWEPLSRGKTVIIVVEADGS